MGEKIQGDDSQDTWAESLLEIKNLWDISAVFDYSEE